MPLLIENRPIGCNRCGYGPVHGREDTTISEGAAIREVRWICPRCNSLIRVDEEVVNETK